MQYKFKWTDYAVYFAGVGFFASISVIVIGDIMYYISKHTMGEVPLLLAGLVFPLFYIYFILNIPTKFELSNNTLVCSSLSAITSIPVSDISQIDIRPYYNTPIGYISYSNGKIWFYRDADFVSRLIDALRHINPGIRYRKSW